MSRQFLFFQDEKKHSLAFEFAYAHKMELDTLN